jgi:hypothetical protein
MASALRAARVRAAVGRKQHDARVDDIELAGQVDLLRRDVHARNGARRSGALVDRDINIYEVAHVVKVAEPSIDALPDFLVGDFGRDYSTPDGSGCKNGLGTRCVIDSSELQFVPTVVRMC